MLLLGSVGMSTPDAVNSGNTKSRWRHIFQTGTSWKAWAVHAVILLPLAATTAFFIFPGFYAQQIPDLTLDDVGRPFRASSTAGFKANRDFQVEDAQATRLRREEARSMVPPLFDLDSNVVSSARQSVHEAFSAMRSILAESRTPSTVRSDIDAETMSRLKAARSRWTVTQNLADEDFRIFVQARFSEDIEKAVGMLLDTAYRLPLLNSREEVTRLAMGMIHVREIGESKIQELHVEPGLSHVFDLKEAYSELERFVSIPGNILPDRNPLLRRAVLRLAQKELRANLTINSAETDERRKAAAEAIKPSIITVRKGQRVIADGELISETHRVLLQHLRDQTAGEDRLKLQFGAMGLVLALWFSGYWFMRSALKRFRPGRRELILLGALHTGLLGILQLWLHISDAIVDRYPQIPSEALIYCVPVAAGAMLVRFVVHAELALFFAMMFSSMAGMMAGNSLAFGLYCFAGSLVAAQQISKVRDRLGIFKAGAVAALVQVLMVTFTALAMGQGFSEELIFRVFFALLGGAIAVPVTVLAVTPLIEFALGYASDLKLLELGNLNHPALKELIVQAPGTYHHSIIIGSLVESAAEAIGANPLLARSCAYFHDIGKGRNPVYFGENQKGDNRHDSLAPAMSAVIIKRHVTEGLEMARKYKLPKLVADAIPQHHGTRLVGFFYHKAVKEQEGRENPIPVDDSVYRYPGPKPQFREAALVMIADAVEAASRSMAEPTTEKLQALVQKLINMIFSEGQLDECDLTLKDLQKVGQSFVTTLEGIYHARPTYPPAAAQVVSPRPDLVVATRKAGT